VCFVVEDVADTPFVLGEAPGPRLEWQGPLDAPESGWGVFLVQQVMDVVNCSHCGDRNRLEMVRVLASEATVKHASTGPAGVVSLGAPARRPGTSGLEERLANSEQAVHEMAEELSTAYERLNLFYSLSQDVNPLAEETDLLQKVLDQARSCTAADWGVVRLAQAGNLELRCVSGTPPERARLMSLDGDGIEQRVARLQRNDVTVEGEDRAVMCIPIVGLEKFLGTLLLGSEQRPNGFMAGDAKLARALADQAAVSLGNHRLYREVVQAKLARRELEVAHGLQQGLYPTRVPDLPGLRLFAEGVAARQVGGDYLALVPRSRTVLDFIVADAMGKGLTAAFFSVITHIAFRGILFLSGDRMPGELLTALNRIVLPDLERSQMFMTALCGRVDVGQGIVHYASAGHCPPLVAHADGRTGRLETADYMLGVDTEVEYTTLKVPFEPGMKLLCYTDGFTDLTDEAGDMVGLEPFQQRWRELADKPVSEICRILIDEAKSRQPRGELQDDLALIGMERIAGDGAT